MESCDLCSRPTRGWLELCNSHEWINIWIWTLFGILFFFANMKTISVERCTLMNSHIITWRKKYCVLQCRVLTIIANNRDFVYTDLCNLIWFWLMIHVQNYAHDNSHWTSSQLQLAKRDSQCQSFNSCLIWFNVQTFTLLHLWRILLCILVIPSAFCNVSGNNNLKAKNTF